MKNREERLIATAKLGNRPSGYAMSVTSENAEDAEIILESLGR